MPARAAARRADILTFMLGIGPTGAAAGLQFFTFALTARALGPEGFGVLAVLYAWSALGVEVAGLGGDAAMVRVVAVEPARFPLAWGHAVTLVLLSWPPVAAVTAGLAASQAAAVPAAAVAALVAGEILLGRAVAATELAATAHGRPVRASLVRLGPAAVRAATAALVFGPLGVADVAPWCFAASAQALVVAVALLGSAGLPRFGVAREAVGFGLLVTAGQFGRALGGSIDRIVLAALLPPAVLGVYASAARLQMLGAIMNQAATRILHPRFFRAAAGGGLRDMTFGAGRQMAVVGLLAAAAIAVAGQALPLVLGPEFHPAAPVAAGLALAAPFVALQYPPADALTASGRQGLRTVLMLAGAASLAGLIAAGALGAGVAGAVAGAVAGQALIAGALWGAFLWRVP